MGQVDLSGAGTLWEVRTIGLVVGQGASGTFNILDSGRLLFDNGTLFAVGLSSGSNGQMTVDGTGSSIDASQTQTRIGVFAGSLSARNKWLRGLEIAFYGSVVFALSFLAGHFIPPIFHQKAAGF